MYSKIQDSGRYQSDERKISIGININQKYDYSKYRQLRDSIKKISAFEIFFRVCIIGYFVFLFESGKTDRQIRAQIFSWMLVHVLSIVFTTLTLISLLKSEVTDYKTYYRIKIAVHITSFLLYIVFMFLYSASYLISAWLPFFGKDLWWVYLGFDLLFGIGFGFSYSRLYR